MTLAGLRSYRTLLLLVVVNLAIAALAGSVVYGYTGPQVALRDELSRRLNELNYRRATTAEDLAYVAANRPAYEELISQGLLEPVDRLAGAGLLEQLRREHGLHRIHYSFSPERQEPLGQGALSRISMRTTDVTIDLAAPSDLEVLSFAEDLIARLPGDAQLVGLRLERKLIVDEHLLTRVRSGETVDVVEGQIQLEWRSLVLPGNARPAPPTS